jgi:hypothetical protein
MLPKKAMDIHLQTPASPSRNGNVWGVGNWTWAKIKFRIEPQLMANPSILHIKPNYC